MLLGRLSFAASWRAWKTCQVDLSTVVLEKFEVLTLLSPCLVLLALDILLHAFLLLNSLLLDSLDVLHHAHLLALLSSKGIWVNVGVALDLLKDLSFDLLSCFALVLFRDLIHDLIDGLEILLTLQLVHFLFSDGLDLRATSLVNEYFVRDIWNQLCHDDLDAEQDMFNRNKDEDNLELGPTLLPIEEVLHGGRVGELAIVVLARGREKQDGHVDWNRHH